MNLKEKPQCTNYNGCQLYRKKGGDDQESGYAAPAMDINFVEIMSLDK